MTGDIVQRPEGSSPGIGKQLSLLHIGGFLFVKQYRYLHDQLNNYFLQVVKMAKRRQKVNYLVQVKNTTGSITSHYY